MVTVPSIKYMNSTVVDSFDPKGLLGDQGGWKKAELVQDHGIWQETKDRRGLPLLQVVHTREPISGPSHSKKVLMILLSLWGASFVT